jgi:hypothetical protein
MKEGEKRAGPSPYISQRGRNKNLCISGEDAEQSGDESWGIAIFEKGRVREMTA